MSTSVIMTGGLQKTQFGLRYLHNAFQTFHLGAGAKLLMMADPLAMEW